MMESFQCKKYTLEIYPLATTHGHDLLTVVERGDQLAGLRECAAVAPTQPQEIVGRALVDDGAHAVVVRVFVFWQVELVVERDVGCNERREGESGVRLHCLSVQTRCTHHPKAKHMNWRGSAKDGALRIQIAEIKH